MTAGPADDRSLAARLTERIRRRGPIPVSEYVEAALYDPDGGFYTTGGRAGRRGDFLTAPEVGGLFGAVLARAIDTWWSELGSPDPLTVIDLGAGAGTLARSVLVAEPAVLAAGALRWIAVERSGSQRADHPDSPMVTSLDRLPDVTGPTVVVANEVLDNLAFDIVERTATGWRELRVAAGPDGGFHLTEGPVCHLDLRGDVPVGTRVPLETAARELVDEICRSVRCGRLVVFDYGADTSELASRPGLGWLRVHRRHDDGGDWLTEPGSCDITVDVAVDQVTADHPPTRSATQAEFLGRHGIAELVAEGREIWKARAHIGDLEALRARSRVSEAEALLDPDGMGGFFVVEWTF